MRRCGAACTAPQVDASSTAFVSCPGALPQSIPAAVSAAQAVEQHGCLRLRIEEGLVRSGLGPCQASCLCVACGPGRP